MGGQPDGEGSIDAETLIHTIKNEFQMTIDIEKLIEKEVPKLELPKGFEKAPEYTIVPKNKKNRKNSWQRK